MTIIKILGIGLAGAVTSIILKEYKPVFAICAGCITAITIFLMLLEQLGYVFDVIQQIAARLSLQTEYIEMIIRIIGIAICHGLAVNCAAMPDKTPLHKR